MRKKFRVSWTTLVLLTFCSVTLFAQQEFKLVETSSYPWRKASDILSFHAPGEPRAEFYVGEKFNGRSSPSARLWKTTDFQNWNSVQIPDSNVRGVELLVQHKGLLYAFTRSRTPRERSVFRSPDGENWSRVYNEQTSSPWGSAISFKGFLFASGTSSQKFLRTSGDGQNPTWTELTSGQFDGSDPTPFVVHDNALYYVNAYSVKSPNEDRIYRSDDGLTWTQVGAFPIPTAKEMFFSEELFYSLVSYQGDLLYSNGAIHRLKDYVNSSWEVANDIEFLGPFLLFKVRGELYAKLFPHPGFLGAVFRRTLTGWPNIELEKVVKDTPDEPLCWDSNEKRVPVTTYENQFIVQHCYLWQYERQFAQVSSQPIVGASFVAGAEQVPVLAWGFNIVGEESVMSLTVRNKGTAEYKTDFHNVALYSHIPNSSPKFIVQLTTNTDEQTWSTDVFDDGDDNLELSGIETFFIKIDIKPSVRFGKTIQFVIPVDGLSLSREREYRLPKELASLPERTLNILGANKVELETFVGSKELTRDQSLAWVFSWSVEFAEEIGGKEESIKSLILKNFGTAEAEKDLINVTLWRENTDVTEKVLDLDSGPDSDEWVFGPQSSLIIDLEQGDKFFVTVDISKNARNRTIQFGIPRGGIGFTLNTSFNFPVDIVISTISTIILPSPAPPAPIAEVIVFPNPAQNEVWFTYDLASRSDIVITIFNSVGTLVSEIRDTQAFGNGQKTQWNSTKMAPGVYFAVVKIKSGSGAERIFKRRVYLKK